MLDTEAYVEGIQGMVPVSQVSVIHSSDTEPINMFIGTCLYYYLEIQFQTYWETLKAVKRKRVNIIYPVTWSKYVPVELALKPGLVGVLLNNIFILQYPAGGYFLQKWQCHWVSQEQRAELKGLTAM